MFWRNNPFVRVVLAMAAGLGLGRCWPLPLSPDLLLAAAGLGWLSLLLWQERGVSPFVRYTFTHLLLVWFFLFGVGRAAGSRVDRALPRDIPEGPVRAAGVLESLGRAGAWRSARAGVYLLADGGKTGPRFGVQLLLEGPPALQPGDTVLFRARLQPLPPPRNPAQFDYSGYLRREGVQRQAFLRKGEYLVLPRRSRKDPWSQGRAAALDRLRRHLTARATFAVGAALVMGHREAIDPGLRTDYQDSGAMHILAVSGLHVGMVYLIAGWLFRPLTGLGRGGRLASVGLRLLALWSFVGLAGAPLSAQRAGLMFSLFSLGRAGFRRGNPLNTLSLAALVMLCLRPNDLGEVGFQLSFLAVGGILIFQPALSGLWRPAHRAGRYLWDLLTVSAAAQLATAPLCAYYFHQLPAFFFLSGLIAVPAAGLILGLGLSVVALGEVPVAGEVLGRVLRWSIEGLNASTAFIADLPGATWSGLYPDERQLAAQLLALGLAAALCLSRDLRWLLPLLATVLGGLLLRAERIATCSRQQLTVCYSSDRGVLIDLIDGRTGHTFVWPARDSKALARIAGPFRASRKVERWVPVVSESVPPHHGSGLREKLLTCRGMSIGFWPRAGHRLDLLYLPDEDLPGSDLLERWPPRRVVLGAAVPWRKAEALRRICRRLGIPLHDLDRQGALLLDGKGNQVSWK